MLYNLYTVILFHILEGPQFIITGEKAWLLSSTLQNDNTYLKIAALQPWHHTINKLSNIVTFYGISRHPKVVDDVSANRNLLASISCTQQGSKLIYLRLSHLDYHYKFSTTQKTLLCCICLAHYHLAYIRDHMSPSLYHRTPMWSPATGLLPIVALSSFTYFIFQVLKE